MSQCNFCILENLRFLAKKMNLKVTVLPSDPNEEYAVDPPGVDVFLHPLEITPAELETDRPDNGPGRFWIIWFWSVGDHCEC